MRVCECGGELFLWGATPPTYQCYRCRRVYGDRADPGVASEPVGKLAPKKKTTEPGDKQEARHGNRAAARRICDAKQPASVEELIKLVFPGDKHPGGDLAPGVFDALADAFAEHRREVALGIVDRVEEGLPDSYQQEPSGE